MYKIILMCLLIFISNTSYGKTKLIKKFKTWNAYSSNIEKKKTCFIASEPIKFEGDYKKENRGKTYVFVTNIKGISSHEVSVVAGFNYKKNSDVFFTIDGKKTKLFPIDDRAWSASSNVDRTLVRLMKKGNKLVVTGTSSPGHLITDTFSLSGFTKALAIIDKNCS